MKKAIIVAAGLSSRLYPITLDYPKGLLKIKGKALLQRSIDSLFNVGVEEVGMVVGYHDHLIREHIGSQVTYITNPFFRHCNMLGSLWLAKSFVNDDPFIYQHGDLIYDPEILLNGYAQSKKSSSIIDLIIDDTSELDEEAIRVRMNKGQLIEASKKIPLGISEGEWTGIAFIKNSSLFFRYAEQVLHKEDLQLMDAYCFSKMVKDEVSISCFSTEQKSWREIDFLEDYNKAIEMFDPSGDYASVFVPQSS